MPLQMAALSTISTTHARQSGVMAAVWSVIAVLGLAIAVATTSLSLQRQTLDRRPSDVAAIVYQASANHLISMCGRYPASPALATAACNSDGQHALLSAQDVRPTPLGLILGQTLTLPALLALSALVYAGLSALALMLSASCLMNWAIVLSQDGLARLYEKDALASRRLALTRMMFMIGLMVIIIGAHWWALSAQQMMAAAFALNTSLYLPLFALALMWRPTAKEALISSFTALLIFAAVFADNGMPQNWDEWARATAWAGLGAFILAGLISLRQPNSARATGKAFVYAIRHGHSDVYSRRHEA
jgi:Na+(H+)/acetate symporter ActP